MAVATAERPAVDEPPTPRTDWRTRLAVLAVVGVVVSPIVVGALALVGFHWIPMGDWASMVYRTSQVGTRNTPLIGAYTVKGWAHPGPLIFWLSAPLYRLSGHDPRSLEWTAALISIASVCGIAAVAWRRGRWPLLLGTMALTATLIHGIGPHYVNDIWNPFVPLLPFALAVLLVWDAGLGRRRALLEAVVPLSFAMQSHLAFVYLTVVLAVWSAAWCWGQGRLLGADATEATHSTDPPRSRRPASTWVRTAVWAAVVVAVLWIGPIIDLLFDRRNPVNIVNSFGNGDARLGMGAAFGLVGRYVRPDGPWLGTAEPTKDLSAVGSGPLPFLLALVALGACIWAARRWRRRDAAALATLTFVLVLGSVPGAAQFVLPAELYLTQWLKIVGGLVWFTVAWTLWRVFEPTVRAVRLRQVAATVVAVGVVVGVSASTWGAASDFRPPLTQDAHIIPGLAAQVEAAIPEHRPVRVEHRGEPIHIIGPGLIFKLISDGYDVRTSDGAPGLKWGHEHRWRKRDHPAAVLTVAVHDAGDLHKNAFKQCQADPSAKLLASYDALTHVQRTWLDGYQLRRLGGLDAVTPAEVRRAAPLQRKDLEVGVFEAPHLCADVARLRDEPDEAHGGGSSTTAAAAGLLVVAAAGAGIVVVRRRRRNSASDRSTPNGG